MAEKGKIIRWTETEWDVVVQYAAELFVSGKASNDCEAFKMANAELPPERRRLSKTLYPSSYKQWGARWLSALKEAREAKKVAETASAEIAPKNETETQISEQETAANPAPKLPTFAELIAQALQVALLEALESPRGKEALRNAFLVPAGVKEETALPMRTEVHPVPQRKRSVLIVGLLGSQQHEIKSSYGSIFDLRFLTQDDASSRMKENAAHVDVTYGMVGYMNHPTDKALKKFAKDYRRVNGTVGDLKRSLTALKAN